MCFLESSVDSPQIPLVLVAVNQRTSSISCHDTNLITLIQHMVIDTFGAGGPADPPAPCRARYEDGRAQAASSRISKMRVKIFT
jgi:hypothetical protein